MSRAQAQTLVQQALQLASSGNLQGAAPLLRQAIDEDSGFQPAWKGLGFALGALGQPEEARRCCEKALAMAPEDFEVCGFLAAQHMRLGYFKQAEEYWRKAAALSPGIAAFHQGLGHSLVQQSRNDEAERHLRRAVELDPDHSGPAYAGLGQVLLGRGDRGGAAAMFRKAYTSDPNSFPGKVSLARAYLQEDNPTGAELPLREALAINSQVAEVHMMLGRVLQQLGRFEEAEESLKRAIEINPEEGPAYMFLTRSRKMGPPDSALIEKMRDVLTSGRAKLSNETALHFALAKSLGDIGDYEAAMSEYDKANAILVKTMLQGKPFDKSIAEKVCRHAAEVFTPAVFEKHRGLGSDSHKPIFIVGMMRSGTTLIEQILSCHPEVGAGGEIIFWADINIEVLGPTARVVDPEGLRRVQGRYLKLLEGKAPGKSRVTDKMPSNYASLGMIHLAFPNAKIIHCMRDPVDTVLSIYMTPNAMPIRYGYVKENIVTAYRQYRKLVAYYRSVLPGECFLDVQYEDLVADTESVTRKMLEFLDLEWNEACLRHEENQRSVSTPTLWQARQPIYSSAVKRWKNYEPWLGAFKELIDFK